MITPRRQKAFLEKLYSERTLTLSDAIKLLAPEKKPNYDHLSQTLNFLWDEDLYSFHANGTTDELWIDKEMLKNADNYIINLKCIECKDRNIAHNFEPRVLEDDIDIFTEKHRWAGIKLDGFLKIVGDLDGAENLAERIRSFTQLFASRLVARNFTQAAVMFSQTVAASYGADKLAQDMTHHEQEYGNFELFDHVFVNGVYCGDHANVSINDQMRLPKGIDTAQRRGESRFDLISVYTPNGMAIHRVMVLLSILDENGLLKIGEMRWDRI